MNAVSRGQKNKKFNLWRCSCKGDVETKNYKMEGKPQNRKQEVSADEIGCQIQAYALYCGTSPKGRNSTKGANSQKSLSAGGDPLNNPSGTSISTWTSCRARPRKDSKIWPKEYGCVVLI